MMSVKPEFLIRHTFSLATQRINLAEKALQKAASVAGLMVTTEAMVAELPKDDAPMGGGDMGGMGGMM